MPDEVFALYDDGSKARGELVYIRQGF